MRYSDFPSSLIQEGIIPYTTNNTYSLLFNVRFMDIMFKFLFMRLIIWGRERFRRQLWNDDLFWVRFKGVALKNMGSKVILQSIVVFNVKQCNSHWDINCCIATDVFRLNSFFLCSLLYSSFVSTSVVAKNSAVCFSRFHLT